MDKILDSETFLIETLQKLIDNANYNFMFPYTAKFDNLANYMFTRTLMADGDSSDTYDRVLLLQFAVDFISKDKAVTSFRLRSNEHLFKSEKSTNVLLNNLEISKLINSNEMKAFYKAFNIDVYSYKDICSVKSEDIVLDCGAYLGDSALYFWHKMNNTGKIYSFEPCPEIYERLPNIIKYLSAQNNIIPVKKGLSNIEGKLNFTPHAAAAGQASFLSPDGKIEVDVTTIDLFAAQENLQRVDFIKMDIEGAECDALRGAEKVIKKYRPKMAICIYHKIEDHWNIPKIILSFDPYYKFYIGHYTHHTSDTVLYCVPSEVKVPNTTLQAAMNYKKIKNIESLYKSVHSQLMKRNNKIFFDKTIAILNVKLDIKLDWKVDKECKYIFAVFSNNKLNIYKITPRPGKVYVEINFDGTKDYMTHDIKEKLRNLLKNINERFPDFVISSKPEKLLGGFCIEHQYDKDMAEIIAGLMIRIVSASIDNLRNMGLLSVEIENQF